jgi:hypothetical protein
MPPTLVALAELFVAARHADCVTPMDMLAELPTSDMGRVGLMLCSLLPVCPDQQTFMACGRNANSGLRAFEPSLILVGEVEQIVAW